MTNAPSQLMTVADFCSAYKCSRTSLYREAAAGRIKLRKFGAATRIALEDAQQWAASLPTYQGGNSNEA